MKHVKFILGRELKDRRESISVYTARLENIKMDLEKLNMVIRKLVIEEIELVKALEVLKDE